MIRLASQYFCLHVLTEVFLLLAAKRQQGLDESQVSGQEDVVRLAGLHLRAPAGLKVVQPRDFVLQHGGGDDLRRLHLRSCMG